MEKFVERYNWIRDLVKAEEQMEETGVVDMSIGYDNDRTLAVETLNFMQELKSDFVEAANAFNELKASPLGRIKIYGIAKTQADFMLFRNGFKMIFSIKSPGVISIRFNFLGPTQYIQNQLPTVQGTGANQLMEENLIEAKKGPFNETDWTFQGHEIKLASVVRYHMSLFIKESAK